MVGRGEIQGCVQHLWWGKEKFRGVYSICGRERRNSGVYTAFVVGRGEKVSMWIERLGTTKILTEREISDPEPTFKIRILEKIETIQTA